MLYAPTVLNSAEQLVKFAYGEIDVTRLATRYQPFRRVTRQQQEVWRAMVRDDLRKLMQFESQLRFRRRPSAANARRRKLIDRWMKQAKPPHRLGIGYMRLDGPLMLQLDGSVGFRLPVYHSAVDFIALIFAEMMSPDSPVEIRECELCTCSRLFVRAAPGHRSKGQPRKTCGPSHAATLRTHRKRKCNACPALKQKRGDRK